MTPRRLFIALPVDDEDLVRSLVKICGHLKIYEPFLKIVPTENFHITIKFFGPVENRIADMITEKFLSIGRLSKVGYRIEGVGAFPSAENPSVIWAGMKCEEKPLTEIVNPVESLASSLGFPPEKRKYVPHLTLARVKKEKAVPSDLKKFLAADSGKLFGSSAFKELVLYESVLKRTGAEYRKVEVIKLA